MEGIDDETGEALVQRDDDKEETVRNRLAVYHEQTKPLVGFYNELAAKDVSVQYHAVAGVGSVDEITKSVLAALAG